MALQCIMIKTILQNDVNPWLKNKQKTLHRPIVSLLLAEPFNFPTTCNKRPLCYLVRAYEFNRRYLSDFPTRVRALTYAKTKMSCEQTPAVVSNYGNYKVWFLRAKRAGFFVLFLKSPSMLRAPATTSTHNKHKLHTLTHWTNYTLNMHSECFKMSVYFFWTWFSTHIYIFRVFKLEIILMISSSARTIHFLLDLPLPSDHHSVTSLRILSVFYSSQMALPHQYFVVLLDTVRQLFNTSSCKPKVTMTTT